MQSTHQITEQRLLNTASRGSFLLRLLTWIATADARYRQSQKLRAMPDVRLRDMGIPLAQADRATGILDVDGYLQ